MKKNYDVFISFKHTDIYGNETEDSRIADRLYKYLTDKGLKVFFSDRELEKNGHADFGRVISDALEAARFLIAVGTCSEHFNSGWVYSEWSSFLNEIRSGRKENGDVFVLYENMNTNDLPFALRQWQAFKADKEHERLYNFINNALNATKSDDEDSGRSERGKLTWHYADGSVAFIYEGEIKYGKANGQGKRTYYNAYGSVSSIYEGEWEDDEFNGQGKWTVYKADGSVGDVQEGLWADGIFIG
ncbi:hypothetical protein FACS189499_10380 [Clostridia bacterium]|nr:hypothetical protein FACS189499_10380 [Clostridia bacterium]